MRGRGHGRSHGARHRAEDRGSVFSPSRLGDGYLPCNLAFPPRVSFCKSLCIQQSACPSSSAFCSSAFLFTFFYFFVFPATLPASHLYYEELILFLHSINNRLLIRIIMESQMAAEQHRGGCGE